MINLIIEAGRYVQIAEQELLFLPKRQNVCVPNQLAPQRSTFLRTFTYVDQVELWYFKLQDLSVILHHLCFYLCTKWPMATHKLRKTAHFALRIF